MDPLDLTLEEIIALNKRRNQDAQSEQAETLSVLSTPAPSAVLTNGKVPRMPRQNNLHTRMEQVNNRLRQNPQFGTRPIHHRLGYQNKPFVKKIFKRPPPNFSLANGNKMWLAQKRVYQAKVNHFLKNFGKAPFQNPTVAGGIVTIRNPNYKTNFTSPLTRNQVMQHNMVNGFKVPHVSPGSTIGSFRSNQPFFRHSIRKALNPALQAEIRMIKAPEEPILLQSLSDFRYTEAIQATTITTHSRFSTYF